MTARDPVTISAASTINGALTASIERVIRGQARATRCLIAGFLAGGHVLPEDLPDDPRYAVLSRTVLAYYAGRFGELHLAEVGLEDVRDSRPAAR